MDSYLDEFITRCKAENLRPKTIDGYRRMLSFVFRSRVAFEWISVIEGVCPSPSIHLVNQDIALRGVFKP